MSGGYFDYAQYRINDIVISVEQLISENVEYSEETIHEFRVGLDMLKKAAIYAQRIDWLVSVEDNEKSFHLRLAEDLGQLCNFEPSFSFNDPRLMTKEELVRDYLSNAKSDKNVKAVLSANFETK
jgi:hypothetical protein